MTTKIPDVAVKMTEAPASINFYGVTQSGWNIQITLRDVDEDTLLDRFGSLVKKLEGYQVTPKQVGRQPEGNGKPQQVEPAPEAGYPDNFCPIHQVEMTKYTKEGRSWYSHKTDDGSWCKGK